MLSNSYHLINGHPIFKIIKGNNRRVWTVDVSLIAKRRTIDDINMKIWTRINIGLYYMTGINDDKWRKNNHNQNLIMFSSILI